MQSRDQRTSARLASKPQSVGNLYSLTPPPDTAKGYITASVAADRSGHRVGKKRELISLAVAITTRCDRYISIQSNEISPWTCANHDI